MLIPAGHCHLPALSLPLALFLSRPDVVARDQGSKRMVAAHNGNGESTDRSSIVPRKWGRWARIGEAGGREQRRVGEGFCNGKLPHEKVVKRGRIVAGRKDRVEEALI